MSGWVGMCVAQVDQMLAEAQDPREGDGGQGGDTLTRMLQDLQALGEV